MAGGTKKKFNSVLPIDADNVQDDIENQAQRFRGEEEGKQAGAEKDKERDQPEAAEDPAVEQKDSPAAPADGGKPPAPESPHPAADVAASASMKHNFTSRLPDGFDFWKSFLTTFCVCTVSCTLQFVALPNSNPLKDPERKGIWHCAVGCPAVWMPISLLYIVMMTGRWVLKGTGADLNIKDLLMIWACSAILFVSSVLFWNSVWVYPFPFGGFPSAATGLIALGIVMWVKLYRRLKELGFNREEFKALLFKGVMVFVVFFHTLVLLVFIMLLLGASQYFPAWACALVFPVSRYMAKRVSEFLLYYVDEEAVIVAETMSMTAFGIGLTLMVGSRGEPLLGIGVAALDILCGAVTSLQMTDNKYHRAFLRVKRFFKEPTEQDIQNSIKVGKATFIASEVGEVIVPVTYVVVFLIVYAGPNPDAFAGIGTSDFGVKNPESIQSFLEAMAGLIVGDFVGTFVLKFLANYLTGLDTIEEMRKFYRQYGLILTIQKIWIIHTAFCAVMIQCGLDYGFQFKMLDQHN